MQSGRAALASSGRISGSGLASARMIGCVGHGLDHLCGQHTGGRAAEEDIAAAHHVGQRARRRLLAVTLLALVEFAAASIVALVLDDAARIDDVDVVARHAQADHDVEAGDRRRAGARRDELDLADGLADEFQPVQQRRAADDCRAMLVVVKDGDLHPLLQLLLDVEALRRFDVFEVDAAERRLERRDVLDQLVRVVLGEFDVEDVDAGELLEQAALAFHHRLGRQRADVAQAEHRGAVGDDADEVAARGVVRRQTRIVLDRQARVGDAG